MDELKKTSPQQMLEDAFRAIYKHDREDENARVEGEDNLHAYQIQWCERFKDTFSFVSQYGGRIVLNTNSDFEVKMYHKDKCSVTIFSESGGYSIEVHPPAPNSEQCQCLESYIYDLYDFNRNRVLSLTLPEITLHVSKGLARSNADNKRLED